MTMKELGGVIDASQVHFDFIGFDACLMAMTEITYDLADDADYIVASQDLEPGNGWAYDNWLSSITVTSTTEQIVNSIVTTYAAEYPSMKGITLSSVDTTKVTTLIDALNVFTAEALDPSLAASDLQLLTSAAQTATEYPPREKYEYIDLGEFMALVAAQATDSGLKDAALAVSSAVDAAVILEAGTVSGATGLSIYLPAGSEPISSDYTGTNFSFLQSGVPGWDDFLLRV